MHVDPVLSAFAADPAAQAGAQDRMLAARDRWRHRPDVAPVLAECGRLAEGASFESCSHLRALLDDEGALPFVSHWFVAMAQAWEMVPLAQLPFRHSYSGGVGAIHLHRVGRVTLAALLVEPRAAVAPATIAFTDCERRERVLAGEGQAIIYRHVAGAPPLVQRLSVQPGAQIACDGEHSRAFVALDAPLVLLRLARDRVQAVPTKEIEIATGRIVHRASASLAEGRAQLAAALLGAMGRRDAATTLADYASGEAGGCGQTGEGARWEAMRNALALDTATGFAALCEIADRPEDPLQPQAAALRHSLRTAYPQLAQWRRDRCRAS
ncbi:hypothetical protein [Alteriqipengyuania sp. 357]